jgi:mono/diheme cytochrome c family protein
MNRGLCGIAFLLIASATVFGGTTAAQTVKDLAIYEKRCGRCHGSDANRLAQTTLRKKGKKIVTRDRATELRKFLSRHGRSTPGEVHRIYSLLRRHLVAEGQ